MKIEKINDHQFRCTLTKEDLTSRSIRLTELAYGSPKARELFNEMMEKACDELGFEFRDMPVMIEAVPMFGEEIVLIISQVEDPEELDTRFSRFTPVPEEKDGADEDDKLDDLLDMVRQTREDLADIAAGIRKREPEDGEKPAPAEVPRSTSRVFSFPDLDAAADACRVLARFYTGGSSLYKGPEGRYYLAVVRQDCPPEEFTKALNMLCEYGARDGRSEGLSAYLKEHMTLLIGEQAVEKLAKI